MNTLSNSIPNNLPQRERRTYDIFILLYEKKTNIET